ncbi:MAG: zinc-ribbon domain-containing protein, partial [Clostridia bacterium]|nr:zinc-ribbon domain-containing protein [Clostridia bacterium]
MFCPNCQTQNPDGVGFCGRCGTPLTAPAAPAQSAYQPPVNAQPAPVSPAVAAVKKVCASPLTLIAAITFTLSWLMGLITILAEPYALVAMIFESLTELDMPITSILEMLVRIEDYLVPGYLILSIPTLFIIFGLWVAYTGNLSRQNPAGRTGGLGLIKAGVIIQMVVALAGLAFGSFLAIGGGITVASSRYTQEMAPVWIAIGVVLLLALVFALIFFIGALKSLTAARVALKTGQVVKKASAFVAVMCFLSALSSLSPLAMLGEDMEITILLSTLCSVVSSLMFGVLIFIYRGKTAPYRVAFAQPVYAQPMYQQPAYQQPAYQPAYQQPVYQQAAQPAYQPVATPAYQPAPQPVAVAAP